MKSAKKIFLSVFFLFLISLLTWILIAHFYGKEVTRYILSQISQNVKVEIHVSQIENLSIFKKFPYASMVLYDVMINETGSKKAEKDTLLFLKQVYLQFNLLDVFRGDFKIKRISTADGFIRMKVDQNGKENYQIGTGGSGSKDDSYLLKLSRMTVSNLDFLFSNALKEQEYRIHCNEVTVKGNFSSDEFLMNIDGDFFTHQLKTEDFEFLAQRNFLIKTGLNVNKAKGIYSLEKGEITIDQKLAFEISGGISEKEKNRPPSSAKKGGKVPETGSENAIIAGIKIKGMNLDISSLMELLPPAYRKSFSDYESKGNISFNCEISGEQSIKETPSVKADFYVEKGSMKKRNTPYLLHTIRMKGIFSNGKNKNPASTMINIGECSGILSNAVDGEPYGTIETEFKIRNLNVPRIQFHAAAKFNLEKLKHFITIDTLENISGTADLNIHYEGAIKSTEEYSVQDFRNSRASGNINFQEVNFSLKQSPLSYQKFSGNLVLHNNDVLIKEMKGNISSSDFELSGLFRNALAFMFLPEEKLTMEAVFYSNSLNLNELLSESETKHDTTYLLALPDRVNFNLNAEVARLSFRKFNADDFHGIITISDKTLRSEDITFKTMEGNVKGSLEIDASSGNSIRISSITSIENININKLFYDFENFGQGVITDKNLKGAATAEVRFSMMMDSSLRVDENKIYSLIDLTINKGELIEFEPMSGISGFIKNHLFLKRIINAGEFEKKLKHIRFSALKNQILIKDRIITVPSMTINSSAMNIEAEGSHTFDNAIDYKINFLLSELLTKKDNVSQEEFGEIEDDGTGKKKIFLTIGGTLDNPVFTYDRKKVKKKFEEEVREEKKLVKGILKEEFGWFRNDSSARVPKKEKKEEFMIEWEENKKTVNDSLPPEKNKMEKKEKNIKKLLDRIGTEEDKKQEDFELEKGEDF